MWIFHTSYKTLHEIFRISAQLSNPLQYDPFDPSNSTWMAVYWTSLTVYLAVLMIIDVPFISSVKQLDDSEANSGKHQSMTGTCHKYNHENVSYNDQEESNHTKLLITQRQKRSQIPSSYPDMKNKPYIPNLKNYSLLKNYPFLERKQKGSNSQSSSYFSTFRSNSSFGVGDVKTNPINNMPPDLSTSTYASHSATPKSSLKPNSPAQEVISEPDFDPDQSVYITSVKNSTAVIPCKVNHIDFSSTVMSWWKEDLPMPLTVGNEISLPRYEIDEKFFYLKVIAQETEPDATKLNDEYVKDDTVANTLWRASSKRKSVHIFSYPGQFPSLTCIVQFSHPTSMSSIHWYHNGNRIYPKMDSTIYENPKMSIIDNNLKMKELYTDVQRKWIDQTTLASRLNIGQLTTHNSGIWTCRKIPGTQVESIEESSVNLQLTGSSAASTSENDSFGRNKGKSPSKRISFSSINLHSLIFLHCIFHKIFPLCV
ncbi:unnamed protein product [Heterobilharzia americana]|nr:unnamed protein product [Heterobilharzia americana]